MTAPVIDSVLEGVIEGLDISHIVDVDQSATDPDLLAYANELDRGRFMLGRDSEELEQVSGIFDGLTDRWAHFRVVCRFDNIVCGGVPNDPNIIKGWLKSKAGLKDEEELRLAIAKTAAETQGLDPNEAINPDQADEVIGKVAEEKHMCVFKWDKIGGVYVEGRQVKAAIREGVNILFATASSKERFGPTKKSPKSFVAERVFVKEQRIYLGSYAESDQGEQVFVPRRKADGVRVFTGHISDQNGSRSALTMYEYCTQPWFLFTIIVGKNPRTGEVDDDISPERLVQILGQMEYGGIGALRSQGTGTFKVLGIEQIELAKKYTAKEVAASIQKRTVQSW